MVVGANARLVAAHEYFRRGEANAEGWSMLIAQRPRLGVGISRSVASRQGGALDAWCQLHRLVLLERIRQGRPDHLGVAGG